MFPNITRTGHRASLGSSKQHVVSIEIARRRRVGVPVHPILEEGYDAAEATKRLEKLHLSPRLLLARRRMGGKGGRGGGGNVTEQLRRQAADPCAHMAYEEAYRLSHHRHIDELFGAAEAFIEASTSPEVPMPHAPPSASQQPPSPRQHRMRAERLARQVEDGGRRTVQARGQLRASDACSSREGTATSTDDIMFTTRAPLPAPLLPPRRASRESRDIPPAPCAPAHHGVITQGVTNRVAQPEASLEAEGGSRTRPSPLSTEQTGGGQGGLGQPPAAARTRQQAAHSRKPGRASKEERAMKEKRASTEERASKDHPRQAAVGLPGGESGRCE